MTIKETVAFDADFSTFSFWVSADVKTAAMQQAMASGAYVPLGELLTAPFRATVIQ